MIDVNKIVKYPLNNGQFFDEEFDKTQIVIHHTSGSSNPFFCVDGWQNNLDKIGTSFVIAGKPKSGETYKDGDIIQCFDDKYWAYHLGVSTDVFKKYGMSYRPLDKTSVGIELTNWGYLTKQRDGTFKNYVGGLVPIEEVVDLGVEYRGYQFYHAYTSNQLSSLRDLLIYLCDKYNITKTYNEGMWKVNQGALNGQNGIFAHVSFRQDKFDCVPQIKLINMLKTLSITSL